MQILLDEGPGEEPVNRPCQVPPVHHPELTLSAHHIFPGLSTLIIPGIKTPRFTYFFRSSFPHESLVNLSFVAGVQLRTWKIFLLPYNELPGQDRVSGFHSQGYHELQGETVRMMQSQARRAGSGVSLSHDVSAALQTQAPLQRSE